MYFKSPSVKPCQKLSILSRLEEIEAFLFLLQDDMSSKYRDIIGEIKYSENLTREKIFNMKNMCPSIFYEIDLVLKGKPSLNIDMLSMRPEFLEIKDKINIIRHHF